MTTTVASHTATLSDDRFDMTRAAMQICAVRLRVRNLANVSEFYRRTLGLVPLTQDAGTILLGAFGRPLLELVGDPGFVSLDPREAGLFHIAFLLPERPDLGRWLSYATEARIPLHGAADHLVSEALYLADPEGNGIEIYVDRPPSAWHDESGKLTMAVEPLDARGLLESAEGTRWTGFPEGGIIGHVHLQVGDIPIAEGFYRDVLGLDLTLPYPGASFFGSGGYHHQIAGNIWNSGRAGVRPDQMAGLDSIEILMRSNGEGERIAARAAKSGSSIQSQGGQLVIRDPWGTKIILTSQHAGAGQDMPLH